MFRKCVNALKFRFWEKPNAKCGSCGGNINVRTCSPKVLTIFEICSNVTDVF